MEAAYTANVNDLGWNRLPRHRHGCSQSGDTVSLGKVKCSNGTIQYKAYCQECGGHGSPLPYKDIEGLDDQQIPLVHSQDAVPCERCGSPDGSEEHHWAPWHLFGDDAMTWPTSYLCLECHVKWHRVVTPNMSAMREKSI